MRGIDPSRSIHDIPNGDASLSADVFWLLVAAPWHSFHILTTWLNGQTLP